MGQGIERKPSVNGGSMIPQFIGNPCMGKFMEGERGKQDNCLDKYLEHQVRQINQLLQDMPIL